MFYSNGKWVHIMALSKRRMVLNVEDVARLSEVELCRLKT